MSTIFRISDGTTTINLLSSGYGFHLYEWTPATSALKGGGIWQNSANAHGQQLSDYRWDVTEETIELKSNGPSINMLILQHQELRRLLVKALDYWAADWQQEPVWLEARAKCETNSRWALIHDGRLVDDDNPFVSPFLQPDGDAVMDNLTLILKRGHWQNTQPGNGNALLIGNPGQEPTTGDQVFIANKHNTADVSHVFLDDGGVFGPNLIGAVPPYNIWPAVPVANDCIYFGCDDGRPFCSLVFDILTPASGITLYAWEYSLGGGLWGPLTVQDNTNAGGAMTGSPFDTAGIGSVHWNQPLNWTFDTINAEVALWVRCQVGAVGMAPVGAVQQNRDIYTVLWPYVEIQAANIGGDIPALIREQATTCSDYIYWDGADWQVTLIAQSSRFISGVRSVQRGNDFSAYFNFAAEQNPTGVTATIADGAAETTLIDNKTYPTGRCWNVVMVAPGPGPVDELRGYISIDSTVVNQYFGSYRCFIRLVQTAGVADDVTGVVMMAYGSLDVDNERLWQSPIFTIHNLNYEVVFDLGSVEIGSNGQVLTTEAMDDIRFYVGLDSAASTGVVDLLDLILIPIDEFAWDVGLVDQYPAITSGVVDQNRYYFLDSIGMPRFQYRAMVKMHSGDKVVQNLENIANSPFAIQSNAAQRIWSLSSYGTFPWSHVICQRIQMQAIQRYLSMRGNR